MDDRIDAWQPPEDLLDDLRAVTGDARSARALGAELRDLRSVLTTPADELTERRHLAAMRAEGGRNLRLRRPRPAARRHGLRAAAASVVTAAALLGGVGVAAANSALPASIQHAVAGVAGAVGLDLPNGSPSHHGTGGTTHRPEPPATPAGERGRGAGLPGQGGSPPTAVGGEPGRPPASDAPGMASAPGAPVATPEHPAHPSDPGNGGTPGSADQPGAPANPGHGATPPGQATRATAPGQSGTAPGQSDTPAAHGNANANANNANGNAAGHGAQANGAGNGQG